MKPKNRITFATHLLSNFVPKLLIIESGTCTECSSDHIDYYMKTGEIQDIGQSYISKFLMSDEFKAYEESATYFQRPKQNPVID